MEADEPLSLEQLVRRHNVIASPIAAMDLEIGMVWRFEGKLRIVISVLFENASSGPIVIVETMDGLRRFSSDTQLDVWHINGEPFIVEAPPEDLSQYVPDAGGNGSPPPAQDAAGIVPVWRGPKKFN